MQTRNRLLDDLARVATGALGVAAGMRHEAEEMLKARFAAILGSEGFATREEFDVVKAMAAKARHENADLARRVEALEAARATPVRKRRRTPAATGKGST